MKYGKVDFILFICATAILAGPAREKYGIGPVFGTTIAFNVVVSILIVVYLMVGAKPKNGSLVVEDTKAWPYVSKLWFFVFALLLAVIASSFVGSFISRR